MTELVSLLITLPSGSKTIIYDITRSEANKRVKRIKQEDDNTTTKITKDTYVVDVVYKLNGKVVNVIEHRQHSWVLVQGINGLVALRDLEKVVIFKKV